MTGSDNLTGNYYGGGNFLNLLPYEMIRLEREDCAYLFSDPKHLRRRKETMEVEIIGIIWEGHWRHLDMIKHVMI